MIETKIFDPADGYGAALDVTTLADPTVVKRGNRWWMYLAGQTASEPGIHLLSASLPDGAPLAATGWTVTPDERDPGKGALLAGYTASHDWDRKGGRHCPSYVRGWDPHRREWVERIYYAGGAGQVWGPYTIGYLEWDGQGWVEQPEPVFVAREPWERGSVYEPNVVYADGMWKMYYVAGSNHADHIVQGFAESADGRGHWSVRKMFATPEEKVFDVCVIERAGGFEAVYARVWLSPSAPPAETGLWWCRSDRAADSLADWRDHTQIARAEDRGWRTGPWKPSLCYGDADPSRMFVFFDGAYMKKEPGGFPFVFTVGCLELREREDRH